MTTSRIKISSIIQNQLPEFVKEEFPLVSEFLKQYYLSLEGQGLPYDLIQNIDEYIKVDGLTNLNDSTELSSDISFFDTTLNVSSTAGFPDSYGLIQIDSEIITYTSKTSTSFVGCVRGFSATTSLDNPTSSDELIFSSSNSEQHSSGSLVKNLSILFLQKFFRKVKIQLSPGFEDRGFYSDLNQSLFVKQSKDFYSSKGTDESFGILFRALYGAEVEVIKPQVFLIEPSDAEYRITNDLVVEKLEGNIEDLINRTVYQDQNDFIDRARGTVTKVEKIVRGEKEYYVLSLDSGYQRDIDVEGSIFGEFTIHPKTKVITPIFDLTPNAFQFSPSTDSIDVDSTAGFPLSGELIVNLDNGTTLTISYEDKTLNQFLGCTGINQEIRSGLEIRSNSYAYGTTDDGFAKFLVTGVLSDLTLDSKQYQSVSSPIKIKTLGNRILDNKANNWFFNHAVQFNVESFSVLDTSSAPTYRLNFYTNHSFVIGDRVIIGSSIGESYQGSVISYNNEKSISVRGDIALNENFSYHVEKILSKVDSRNYPSLSKYTSNVQNVYVDHENSFYVAAPSLPTYLDQKIEIKDRSSTFSGFFSGTELAIGKHSFYTGDSVYYRSGNNSTTNVSDGYYFTKRIDENTVSLARSIPNIFDGKFVTFNGVADGDRIEFSSFVDENTLEQKHVQPQKIFRKLSDPIEDGSQSETNQGSIGILVNGVEILNYKSQDSIFYGPIEKIEVLSSGDNYDVINPPLLEINDQLGTGSTAYCSVNGSLKRIDIIDGGFDYIEVPKIIISGGGGSQASAEASLIDFDHVVFFNSDTSSALVSTAENSISFTEYHKFRDNELVIYDPQGQTIVGGLSTNSQYYVSVQDAYKIKLHKNFEDSVSGINTISLTSFGVGIHKFQSTNKKKKIGSILISNGGSNYRNKKTVAKPSGISTASNTIEIRDHGYSDGDILVYSYTEQPIVGLANTLSYYISVVDENRFKLSTVGLGTFSEDFYKKTNQYVNLEQVGSGLHIFNYEPINVIASGVTGVSTLSGQDFGAILQPVFRGEIESVHVQDGGLSYGSEDILNYSRQPDLTLRSGSGAQLTPIINDGKIESVIINYAGSYYNSTPDIIVNGPGFGAVLTPNISNGTITSINIVSGGIGYVDGETTIDIIASGSSAKFNCEIKSWNVNLVERFIQSNQITNDDGISLVGLHNFGIQYFHAYSPRKLRSSVLGRRFSSGEVVYEPDLIFSNGREQTSISHSPIIGWAYDGNPIYGPYGYSTITGGSIKRMVSGYQLKSNTDRPSSSIYPFGFFVEDYEFVGNGDLDEHNGRFCVTPEYPNGVYAYFCTIEEIVETSGIFKNYKKPSFPYFIGHKYKSLPISYNFLTDSNQTTTDINATGWFRNTTPYNLGGSNSGYDFILNPSEIRNQNSIIKSISSGEVTFIGVETGGRNYQVGDVVRFSTESLNSIPPRGIVSSLSGKRVTNVSSATSSITNVEFYKKIGSDKFTAISTSPHGFNNLDLVTFIANEEYDNYSQANISRNILRLTAGINSTSSTGFTTYFNVSGNLSDSSIQENDIYQISDEQVKILNIDAESSRIRVLRNQNGTVGVLTYSAGTILTEVFRRMDLNFNVQNNYEINKRNKQYYLNPLEAVGIGTTSGVGITSTLTFSNPGVGATQISIPTRSIYIPNHNLNNGDELIYSSGNSTPISVSNDGITSFELVNNSIVYATRITNNIIGISTFRVGLSSLGTYVGLGSTASSLLYFTGIGTGSDHSLKTNYPNILVGEIIKNEVTVSTASSHGLSLNEKVVIDLKSKVTKSVQIKYNDYNRRTIVNAKEFTGSDVDTAKNTISIQDHGLVTGQKIIHTSSSPCGGLSNERIYYVISVDSNTIKLSNTSYYSERKERDVVNITTTSFGTISPINPPINLVEGEGLQFDVSDSSLSFVRGSSKYSAFDLNFYIDSNFQTKFNFSQTDFVEVIKSGNVGIETTAYVTLRNTSSTPKTLYYKLDPINTTISPTTKKEAIIDTDVAGFNQILVRSSVYSGEKKITGISTDTFTFISQVEPEISSYDESNSTVSYKTNSNTAYGPIDSILVKYPGKNLKSLPKNTIIETGIGTGAILDIGSKNVANIAKIEIEDIGFDYPSDLSIRPTAKAPDTLTINSQNSFKFIGVSSVGNGYSISPDLIVLDGFTGKLIDDVDLRYTIGQNNVDILKNTKGISNSIPVIIPINNTNGVKITSIDYNSSNKNVVVTLGSSFSNSSDFPFEVGDKVLVENVSVGVGSTGIGYNSENYNYSLFTITSTTPNIGGIGATITYNLSDYLNNNETPGTYDPVNSSGRVIPQKHFPIFDIVLEKNQFYIGEEVVGSESFTIGKVVEWDSHFERLKVSTSGKFNEGELITGKSSASKGSISSISETEGYYTVAASSFVQKGWERETGFLNNQFQRVHDNDYYQYFSYSIKSKIPFDVWDPAVGNLNHTAGFKRFGDLTLESYATTSGISTSQDNGNFLGIADLSESVDLNCVYDYDLVKENSYEIDGKTKSNQILFNSKTIQDYIESIGNRVLLMDDIGLEFNSQPRSEQFTIVDRFVIDVFEASGSRSIKYVAFVRDSRFSEQKQISLVTLVHDGSNGYINQYGGAYTTYDMGSYDFVISGVEGNLLFYPVNSKVNDYNISTASIDIRDAISSVGSFNLGDTVSVGSATSTITSGTAGAATLVGIASTYRSSKVLVQIGATDSSYYEFDEITVIHDGSEIYLEDYGQVTTSNLESESSPGLGTYHAYYSGSNINIDLIPYQTTSVGYNVNCAMISIASTSSTGVGTESFSNSRYSSRYAGISSSASPGITTIASYETITYDGAYCIVSVEDLTNSQYKVSEVIVINDASHTYMLEFGTIDTGSSIGSIGSTISNGTVSLTFTPEPNIDVEVRTYQTSIGVVNPAIPDKEIDFGNAYIRDGFGFYEGSETNIRKSFQLTYNQDPIFERYFDGSDSLIVDTQNDTISIPRHFFSTGEEIEYVHAGTGTTQAIGIAATNVPGIGITDKMPSTVYIVKDSEIGIQVAASASESLRIPPNVFDITSVGIGTLHKFTSKKQNSRVLVTIDNAIQSPIVATSVTTTTVTQVELTDNRIVFSGITSFFSGDFIQIDDEIMKITTVGLGSTNVVLTQRFQLGTGISSHPQNSLITKLDGNYNITGNVINFVEAPYGLIPISTTSNPPDARDFVGIETRSSFSGRAFIRSGIPNDEKDAYYFNYIFDDISPKFNGFSTSFTLTSDKNDVSGISTGNGIVLINGVFQGPDRSGFVDIKEDYFMSESAGATQISFTGSATSISSDINTANIPRGGIIISIGSSNGFGFQPLVAAGGTAVVSTAGTIQSISIGNSGSGYRVGIQTVVNVSVATSSNGTPNIEFIGTAAVSNGNIVSVAITNPGVGYTSTNPPIVIFDSPLPYFNVPLVYSSSSVSGVGTEATVDIVVGNGSSIVSLNLRNYGYGYGVGEILTVDIGGISGIPTDTSLSYEEFQLTIEKIYTDSFNGWTVGELQVIDSIDSLFDGKRTTFPIKINGNQTTIRAKKGSVIEVKANLLIFINDILQVPDISYTFEGGSVITFNEAPKPGDTSKILFYKGTGDIDTISVDILETIKEGDIVRITSDSDGLTENERLVSEIISTDILETITYSGPGITNDPSLLRPLTWCRQTEDKIVSGQQITKDRVLYEPLIQPTTNIIQNVSTDSTEIFVESVKTFFDSADEYIQDGTTELPQRKILIITQDSTVAAAASAIVSSAGTISSIIISDGGVGYSTSPTVILENPVGLGTTQRAEAVSTILNGSVNSISVTNPGSNYSVDNPPVVLIDSPSFTKELVEKVYYDGDFGIISGVSTVSVGVASTGLVFDFFIPENSFLRDLNINQVGIATTGISGIQTGYYFVVRNSNIGFGLTSLDNSGNTVGFGSTFIDNVYQAVAVSIAQTHAVGVGLTYVARVTVSVQNYNGLTGLGYSNFYGEYSWGRLYNMTRNLPQSFTHYTNGILGVSTSPIVQRYNPLKYQNYTT